MINKIQPKTWCRYMMIWHKCIDDDGEMCHRLIEFQIVYELFRVPNARRLTYSSLTICTLLFHMLGHVDWLCALYVLRPACAIVCSWVNNASRCLSVFSLICRPGTQHCNKGTVCKREISKKTVKNAIIWFWLIFV